MVNMECISILYFSVKERFMTYTAITVLDVKCPSNVSALIKEMKEYKSSVSLFLHQHAYVFIPNIWGPE